MRLAKLLRSTNGAIRVEDAADALSLERAHAAKLLAAWHNQGSLRRVARGLYVPITPASLDQDQVLEDPWVLVPELYQPGYVGGWSALEHWELTEQLFRSICVLTAKRVSQGEKQHQGVSFFVKQIAQHRIFGTKTLWRGTQKVQISDPHKTILDVIANPQIGAGLQHTVDAVYEYQRNYAERNHFETLLSYAELMGVGSLFKKLGYLCEQLHFPESFVDACAERLTTGYAHLDKSSGKERLVTKWRLWVPEGFKP